MQKWLWQPCRGLVFQGETIWSKNCLIAPSGALYVTMCHYKSSAATPIFCFSIQPMPRCRRSHSGLLLQYQCNWKQLTEQSSLAGAYQRPQTSLLLNYFDQRFSMLGWSDGGITALCAAIQQPKAIEKVLVITFRSLHRHSKNIS